MKKRMILPMLALCALLLTSCRAQEALEGAAQSLREANEESAASATDTVPAQDTEPAPETEELPASAADAAAAPMLPEELLPEYEEAEPEPEPGEVPAEPVRRTLDELVADAPDSAGKLPRVLLDSVGAEYINDDIEGSFRYLVDADYCQLYYEAYLNGDILSVVVVQQYDDGEAFYTPYNLNAATGERLTGGELMDYLGISREIVGDNELAAMAEEFEYMWGGLDGGDTAAFYQEQYENTVSTENAEFSRLWLGRNGELYFAARLYAMAGAGDYEYPMSTGLKF